MATAGGIDWAAGRGHIEIGPRRLEWLSVGRPAAAKPVLTLLHEGLGCAALWRDFPQRLEAATGCAVFAFSRAGYGRSDPCELPRPLDYMTREAVEVLPRVLRALEADSHILLGHSDGATIASEYAGRVEDPKLRGLILMAPHFFTEPMGLAEIARAGAAFETTDLKTRMAKYHQDPETAFRGWNDAWLNEGFRDWFVADAIDRYRTPTLVIQGKDDQYGTLAQVEEVERRSPCPVERHILDDCRHSPHLDRPDRTVEAVAAFVGRL